MRRFALAGLLVVLAVVPAAAAAKRPAVSRMHPATIANMRNVPYMGGPVLHWNRTHLIFWQPSGSGLTYDPGYQSLIETFLGNVAAASRSSTSVYGVTGQYTDRGGPAAYVSTYGGAVTATDPLPSNGCTNPRGVPTGWTVCLTDEQLQREIEHVVRTHHLPTGSTDLYFLVTPNGLGDCDEASGVNQCALAGDINGYCGYHAQTVDGLVLYAVIPYNAVPGHCQSDNPRPNGSTADPAISTISHEQTEMITDPLSNAWVDSSGEEIGDVCITNFGPAIGGTGGIAWNENINGGHYYLQEEWSNYNGGCVPRAKPDSVAFQAGMVGSRTLSVWFRGRASDPQGKIVSYRWSFGDGRGAAGWRAVHRYGRSGRYRVVLRITDSWGNWAYYAATLTVGRTAGRASRVTNPG